MPRTDWGSMPQMAASASTSAERVSMLSQKITAYPTIELLSTDRNCPLQMMANVFFQLCSMLSVAWVPGHCSGRLPRRAPFSR